MAPRSSRKALTATHLDDPVPGGGVVAQVAQHSVEADGVQLGLVNKEQHQQAGHCLVVQQLATPGLAAQRGQKFCF